MLLFLLNVRENHLVCLLELWHLPEIPGRIPRKRKPECISSGFEGGLFFFHFVLPTPSSFLKCSQIWRLTETSMWDSEQNPASFQSHGSTPRKFCSGLTASCPKALLVSTRAGRKLPGRNCSLRSVPLPWTVLSARPAEQPKESVVFFFFSRCGCCFQSVPVCCRESLPETPTGRLFVTRIYSLKQLQYICWRVL